MATRVQRGVARFTRSFLDRVSTFSPGANGGSDSVIRNSLRPITFAVTPFCSVSQRLKIWRVTGISASSSFPRCTASTPVRVSGFLGYTCSTSAIQPKALPPTADTNFISTPPSAASDIYTSGASVNCSVSPVSIARSRSPEGSSEVGVSTVNMESVPASFIVLNRRNSTRIFIPGSAGRNFMVLSCCGEWGFIIPPSSVK